MDDYQYQPQQLPPKNEGLFGFGGKPNEGSRGFEGSIVDYGTSSSGGGLEGPPGPEGPAGPAGSGSLADGVYGDILYYDGNDWVGFGAPSSNGTFVLGFVNGALEWVETVDCSTPTP